MAANKPVLTKKVFKEWIMGMLYGETDFDLQRAKVCKKKSEEIIEFGTKYNLFHPEIKES